jgi:hypothetical protein
VAPGADERGAVMLYANGRAPRSPDRAKRGASMFHVNSCAPRRANGR